MLYRGLALVLLAGGLSGVMYASVTGEQSAAQRIVSAAVGLLIAVASVWLALHPRRFAGLLHARAPLVIAFGLLFIAAVAACTGMAFGALSFAGFAFVALGGALVPGRWWVAYGSLAAALTLAAGFATGENRDLPAQHFAGWVLVGVSVSCVNFAFFGHELGRIAVRLRRLEGVLALERERIAAVLGAVAPLRALLDTIAGIALCAERAAAGLPGIDRARLLEGVARSRAAALALRSDLPDSVDGPGLRVRLEELTGSYAHLTVARRVRLDVYVEPLADRVPARVAECVGKTVLRALDNVCDHAARLGDACALRRVQITVSTADGDALLRCVIEDDAGGAAPYDWGEGSELSAAAARSLGGRFCYEQGEHGVRVVLELPRTAGCALVQREDHPRERIVPAAVRSLSRMLRATRRTQAIALVAQGVDVAGGTLAQPIATSAIAVLTVEALMHRAGLRGERPDGSRWVLAAVGVAIVASGAIDQADRFQTSGWAAMVMLEVAWRQGWRPWLASEIVRAIVVVLTLSAPTVGFVRGFGVQVLFPFGIGILAFATNRLAHVSETLEAQVGSAGERWTAIQTAVAAAQQRHDVIKPLQEAIEDSSVAPETLALSERLDALAGELQDRITALSRTCAPARNLLLTIRDTLSVMLAPVPVKMTAQEVSLDGPSFYPGALIERYGRRTALLDLLAKIAEACQEACPPHPWGSPRLRRLDVSLHQASPYDPIYVTVLPIPAGRPTRSLDGEVALFAGLAGAEVEEGPGPGAFTIKLGAGRLG